MGFTRWRMAWERPFCLGYTRAATGQWLFLGWLTIYRVGLADEQHGEATAQGR